MVKPSFPNLISYGQNALRKKQESQHAKDFMALNLRRIKLSYLMPRKAMKGGKSFNHKHQDKRSSPPPDQKKQEKKYLSQIQCYRCKKYGHYASSCRSSIKRKHEASTVGVGEDPPRKEPRKDDHS